MDKPAHYFDTRVVERNIAAGLITREDYKAFLDGLEDCEEQSAQTETRFLRHDDVEDDD